MARNTGGSGSGLSRRKFIVASGAAGLAGLAGCGGGGNNSTDPTSTDGSDGSGQTDLLTAGGSSTVYPITNGGSKVWNYNPPADDSEYWPHDEYDIDTDKRFADYWASQFGFETNDDGNPPFRTSIGISHSSVGLNKVQNGQVDLGDASAPVETELSGLDDYSKFVDHVVGIDAMQIIVSKSIYDAGVHQLTLDEVAKVYRGEVTNWSALGGPDEKIQCVGRVEGSGTRAVFHENVLDGGAADGVDVHQGKNQQVASSVSKSSNAIGYVAWAFVDEANPAVSLKVGDTVYSPGNDNLNEKDYPLNRDLHCYTYDGTSPAEAAFLNMLISDFGQGEFVEPNDYIALPDARQEEERQKLEQ